MAYQEYWDLYKTHYDGQAVNIRLNQGIEEYVCHPRYMYQINICVPLNHMDDLGFPFDEESRLLDELEELLREKLETQKVSVFAASVTCNGIRMYIIYTYIPDYCKKVVDEINRVWVYHSISHTQQEDRYWETIEQILQN